MKNFKNKTKRKPNIAKSLMDSSISAFLSMIEIHNKPRIEYRYPTSVILIVNAWELALKSYIYKYISSKLIWKDKKTTITIIESINILISNVSQLEKNNFKLIEANINALKKFRNEYIHYNVNELDPVIYGLLCKSALLFYNFVKNFLGYEISIQENFLILPIGLRLPYNPISFLETSTNNCNDFCSYLIREAKHLNDMGIEDSIFISLDVNFNSIKNVKNSDIIVNFDKDSNTKIALDKRCIISNDKGAQRVTLDDDFFSEKYKLSYNELRNKIKTRNPKIKFNQKFNQVVKEIKNDQKFTYERWLNPNSRNSSKTYFYSEDSIDIILERYSEAK